MTTEEYVPFGEEWKNELMKLPKIQIIAFLRAARLEIEESKEYSNQQAQERYDEAVTTLKPYYKDPALFKALKIASGLTTKQ